MVMEDREEFLKLLTGSGIEIGPLHRPCVVPHLTVKYVDRLSKADLLDQYPELAEHPIVEADILDDAETLSTIDQDSQQFVIANHVIEHMANPILALENWARVLKPGGRLFLAVPDKNTSFDVERPITELSHIIEDYKSPSLERDYRHFEDFAHYVSCRQFKVRPENESKQFAKELFDKNYSIHFHVWDFPAFNDVLQYMQEARAWPMKLIASRDTIGQEFLFVAERKAV